MARRVLAYKQYNTPFLWNPRHLYTFPHDGIFLSGVTALRTPRRACAMRTALSHCNAHCSPARWPGHPPLDSVMWTAPHQSNLAIGHKVISCHHVYTYSIRDYSYKIMNRMASGCLESRTARGRAAAPPRNPSPTPSSRLPPAAARRSLAQGESVIKC